MLLTRFYRIVKGISFIMPSMDQKRQQRRDTTPPTEMSSLLPDKSSSTSLDVVQMRTREPQKLGGEGSSRGEKIRWDDRNAIFKADRQREVDLLNEREEAKKQLKEWKDTCPDPALGSKVEAEQLKKNR